MPTCQKATVACLHEPLVWRKNVSAVRTNMRPLYPPWGELRTYTHTRRGSRERVHTHASSPSTAGEAANAYSHVRPLPPTPRGSLERFYIHICILSGYADASTGHRYLSPRAYARCFSRRRPKPRLSSRRGQATAFPITVAYRRVPPASLPPHISPRRGHAPASTPTGGMSCPRTVERYAHASTGDYCDPSYASCLLQLQEGACPRLPSLTALVHASTETATCHRAPPALTSRRGHDHASI